MLNGSRESCVGIIYGLENLFVIYNCVVIVKTICIFKKIVWWLVYFILTIGGLDGHLNEKDKCCVDSVLNHDTM